MILLFVIPSAAEESLSLSEEISHTREISPLRRVRRGFGQDDTT